MTSQSVEPRSAALLQLDMHPVIVQSHIDGPRAVISAGGALARTRVGDINVIHVIAIISPHITNHHPIPDKSEPVCSQMPW